MKPKNREISGTSVIMTSCGCGDERCEDVLIFIRNPQMADDGEKLIPYGNLTMDQIEGMAKYMLSIVECYRSGMKKSEIFGPNGEDEG
jgi:hypothetical protein